MFAGIQVLKFLNERTNLMQESESRETCGVLLMVVASFYIVLRVSLRHFQFYSSASSKTFYFTSSLYDVQFIILN